MAIGKKLRFEVFKRDKFTCQYCGRRPPDVILHCDHILAKAEGGKDDIENLTTSCLECNLGKGANNLGKVAPHLDELEALAAIQEMAERRVGLKRAAASAEALREAEDNAVRTIYGWWNHDVAGLWKEPKDWQDVFEVGSVRRFLKRLSLERLREAVTITGDWVDGKTYGNSPTAAWKYFCGVCWKMIKEGEEPF